MDALKYLSDWNRDVALAIAALGSSEFFPALIDAVRHQVPLAYPQVWLYHKDLPPRLLYHEIPDNAVSFQIDLYLDGLYREDPFYQISVSGSRGKIYRLSRLTAGRLEESSNYRDYFAASGTVDEAIFLSRVQGGSIINLDMMRVPSQGLFTDDEYQLLYSLAEAVSELMRKHTEFDAFAVSNLIQPGIDHQIDLAFKTFGSSMLSPREKDVMELMLRGYGTDTSADRLAIARETVRRHRKSIYRKLDVNSQTDLFALFINSMSCMGQAAGGDPLLVYMGPT